MAQCQICKEFYPPGFTKPIPETKNKFKCKFCEEGKDRILVKSSITGDVHWDVKADIVNEYKQYLHQLYNDKKKRESLYRGINEDK